MRGDAGRTQKCHTVSLRYLPDGSRVVSGSDDKTLKVWDVATGKCVATLEGHSGDVYGVAVFPDGRRVVSVSRDNTLKVWDVAQTGECVATLEGHSNTVSCVAVFPDGRRVVSGSTTRRSRCGTWRPASAWRRWKGTLFLTLHERRCRVSDRAARRVRRT